MIGRTTPRRHHLIDIENVCGGNVTEHRCAAFLAAYTAMGLIGAGDLVVVGAGPRAMPNTMSLPAGWRRVLGHGPDGADYALLDALPATDRLHTFGGGLVIVSRDHKFCLAADRAHAHGLAVTVVGVTVDGRCRSCSHELRSRADHHPHLDLRLAA